jgi:hypothetical protein
MLDDRTSDVLETVAEPQNLGPHEYPGKAKIPN